MYLQETKLTKQSIFATIFVMALIIILAVIFYTKGDLITGSLMLIMLIAMCLSAFCFYPTKIGIDNGFLTVIFPLRRKHIPLSSIKSVRPYKMGMNCIRTCGSGGFFGWWGWFRNRELGSFMVYATDLNKMVYIELNNKKKYVISCADPEAMTDAIQKIID